MNLIRLEHPKIPTSLWPILDLDVSSAKQNRFHWWQSENILVLIQCATLILIKYGEDRKKALNREGTPSIAGPISYQAHYTQSSRVNGQCTGKYWYYTLTSFATQCVKFFPSLAGTCLTGQTTLKLLLTIDSKSTYRHPIISVVAGGT